MPGKTAKSAPLPPFGLSGMTALVRAATLSCENAGKSQKCTQDRSHPGNPGVYGKKFANRLCAVEASHMKLQGRFCYMAFEDLATIWSHLVVKPEIR
jgi:hypothetical protein